MRKLNNTSILSLALFVAGSLLTLLIVYGSPAMAMSARPINEPAESPSNNDDTVIEPTQEEDSEDDNVSENGDDSIKLVFAGDIMLARKVKTMVKNKGNGDYKFPFLYVADYLKSADIAFANLESIISDKGRASSFFSMLSGVAFRADPKAVYGLTYAGIDIVSVANNHTFDYGRTGMEDSFTRLQNAGIKYVGGGFTYDEAYSPVIMNVKGKRIAYLAYTNVGSSNATAQKAIGGIPGRSGTARLSTKNLEQGVYQAREDADIVIVSMHFGMEYEPLPSGAQDRYAHLAIDRGADLVIGSHPHVIQPVMVYMKGYIAYSLGNFVFDMSGEKTKRGMLLEVLLNEDGEIAEVKPKYVNINKFYQPEIE